MDEMDGPKEILKISIPGRTVKALSKAKFEIFDFWHAKEITLKFSEHHVSIYSDGQSGETLSLKSFENPLIKVSQISFNLHSIKSDLQALYLGNYEEFFLGDFDIHIYLVKNGSTSQFWCTFRVGRVPYEIDILEYNYQEKGIDVPVDSPVSPRKNQSKKFLTSNSKEVIQPPSPPPVPVEKKVILPKMEPDTATKDNDDDLCKNCITNDLCTINLPCGHMFFCIQCSFDWKKNECPICKMQLNEIKKVFK